MGRHDISQYDTEIRLQINVRDIKNYISLHHPECPVDIALKKAGFPHLKDNGMGITNTLTNIAYKPNQIFGYAKLFKLIKTIELQLERRYQGTRMNYLNQDQWECIIRFNQ